MSPSCPNCKGHNISSLSVIYESVTSPALLQLAAPPKKGSYFLIMEFWFVGTMIMDLAGKYLRLPAFLASLALLAIFAVSVLALMRAHAFNKNEWPAMLKKWKQSYLCMECSHVFTPPVQ